MLSRTLLTACTLCLFAGTVAARPGDPPGKSHGLLDELLIPSDKVRRGEEQPDNDGQKPIVAVVVPHSNIFPALVVAQAGMEERRHEDGEAEQDEKSLGDPFGVLGVGVVAPADHVPVRVVVSCPSILRDSSFEGTLTTEGETYSISPKIKWDYEKLLRTRQQVPVDVSFRVKVGDAPWKEITRTCTLRSINDCLLAFDIGEEYTDTTWLYAAYVNEDHPWVDGILKDALATGVVESFTGYQTQDPEEVMKQVYAVWRVCQNRGIRYSDISTVSAQKRSVVSQHVRFLDECMKNKQANCIDGTVMFASVLRKIGIQTHIVTIPNHAFLTFRPNKDADDEVGLETTLIGRVSKDAFEQKEGRLSKLFKILGEQETYEEASFRTFEQAVAIGSKNFRDNLEHFANSEEDPNYWFISVDEAREKGVRPLAYMRDEPDERPDGKGRGDKDRRGEGGGR
ncbi:MAG: hypothetical protein U0637_10210 [Phycisphaerales bacterium]